MSNTDAPSADAWAVYLLECIDGRVYTGIARDPRQRYIKHLSGKGARFTRSNPPKQLLGWVWVANHGDALRLEIAWKKLPRADRIAALLRAAASDTERKKRLDESVTTETTTTAATTAPPHRDRPHEPAD